MSTRIETPWPTLNGFLSLEPGDLVLLAGPGSSGVSMAALNIATHVGFELGDRVAIYSAEISHDGTMTRIISERLGIDSAKLHRRNVSEGELARVKAFGDEIADTLLEIAGDAPVNLASIRAHLVSRAQEIQSPRLLMVDGLHLVTGDKSLRSPDVSLDGYQQARVLKALAQEFNVTVVATEHLHRRVECRPMLADVSADLAGTVDAVLLLHSPAQGLVDMEIAKNRRGKAGKVVTLDWQPELTRLRELRK